ncbi:PREDICTED: POC1 centriolar protein homolog A-like [Trachymyrmex cornetzi]|uniref:POC1 centriolar protein homolog A-like n=1 Tax=Trachymyrmex cornetzi TaxID=471704 RepID=UPI00084F7D99|nr:PREDICTED: POC1 centriolar protein homolog A-like [Trachymyrmex cornetzi]
MEETARDPRRWKCLTGHYDDITALSFHPLQNNRFVTGSLDKTIRAWRLDTWTQYESVKAHKAGIFDICYSPDGELIASASADRSIRVRSSYARHYFTEFRAHRLTVRSVQFNPSGDKFVSASDDTTVKLWIPFLGNFFKMFIGHTSSVRCAKFSPDGKLLVSCSNDKTIKIWDITSDQCIKTFEHKEASRYVDFHPTGITIGSADKNGCVKLYDLRTNSIYQHFAVHEARVNMIKYHPNGNFMLTASDDTTMKVLDLLKGCPIYTFKQRSNKVTCVAFSNDGKFFASSDSDRRIQIWKSNNLFENGRVSDIPQLTSIQQELDNMNEESYSNECKEDTYVKQDQANYLSNDFKKSHLESDNMIKKKKKKEQHCRGPSSPIVQPKVIDMNIEPFQKDSAGKIFSQRYHSSKQSQTVPENQTSSNKLSSNQFFVPLEVDKVLDKIQLSRYYYNVLEQRLIVTEETLKKLGL